MKTVLIAASVLSLAVCGAAAAKSTAGADKTKACAAEWKSEKAAKTTGGVKYADFYKSCMATAVTTSSTSTTTTAPAPKPAPFKPASAVAAPAPVPVARPAPAPAVTSTHHVVAATTSTTTAPAGATAICKDGTSSQSKHHSGTCSHHGGVAKWL